MNEGVDEVKEFIGSRGPDEIEIPAKHVGEQLFMARTKQNLSIEQIENKLKWSVRQIAEMEAGNYAVFHDLASIRGFIRAYAKIVKLDAAPLLDALSVEFAQCPTNALDRPLLDTPFPPGRMRWLGREYHRSYRILGGLFLGMLCLIVMFVFWAELGDFFRIEKETKGTTTEQTTSVVAKLNNKLNEV